MPPTTSRHSTQSTPHKPPPGRGDHKGFLPPNHPTCRTRNALPHATIAPTHRPLRQRCPISPTPLSDDVHSLLRHDDPFPGIHEPAQPTFQSGVVHPSNAPSNSPQTAPRAGDHKGFQSLPNQPTRRTRPRISSHQNPAPNNRTRSHTTVAFRAGVSQGDSLTTRPTRRTRSLKAAAH